MRILRSLWTVVTVVATVLSGVAGWITLGAPSMLASALVLTALGATLGLAWSEGPGKARTVLGVTGWSLVAGVLLVGSPSLIGGWSLLLMIGLAATSPPAVTAMSRGLREWRLREAGSDPTRLSDGDLLRRWRATYDDLNRPDLTPAELLGVVQQRASLLDELERRDPDRLTRLIVHDARVAPRTTWSSPGR